MKSLRKVPIRIGLMRSRLYPILFLSMVVLGGHTPAYAEELAVPIIAAAADLQFAVEEIAKAFKEDSGQEVKVTFGSTGNLARQIREGAPFQLFMAADEQFIFDLARDGLLRDQGRLYAEGRIVIMVPHGSAISADEAMNDLKKGIADGRVKKFAIANPEHAPYGMRAQEALKSRGLWNAIQPLLVMGENVAQAAQFATSGNAQGGIIAYSLALSPRVSKLGTYALIPQDWHEPLLQRMALTKAASPTADAFYAYLQSPRARDIMEQYGFVLPDMTPPAQE